MTTENKPGEAVMRVWARLMKTQTQMLNSVERALKDGGMPPLAWYDVLLEVERAGPKGLRPLELERELLLAQYNLSRLLDRMEKAGYIKRHAHQSDGRGRVVTITRAGKTLRRKMWPLYSAAIQRALGERLTVKQAGHLDKLLGRLLAEG